MKYTDAQKEAMYSRYEYVFQPPNVCTTFWNRQDWIKWVDASNGWRPKTPQHVEEVTP